MRDGALSTLAVLAAALILGAPALWNGFPFLYWDSVDYITMPFTGEVPMYRTVSYSIAMLPAILTGTTWATAAAQCLVMAYVLHEALHVFLGRRVRAALVGAAAGLAAFTALPWFTGQLMADVFAGVVVLGLATLAYAPAGMGWGRRAALLAVLVVAAAVHTSHIALAAGLALVFLALRALAFAGAWRWLAPRVLPAALVVALGAGLAAGANWTLTGAFYVSQSNAILLLGRLVQDGIVKRYLDEVCPQGAALRLCPHRDRLPDTANGFLWGYSPFGDVGGWSEPVREEAAAIIADSLRRYPWAHVKAAVALTVQQLFMLRTGDGLRSHDTWFDGQTLEEGAFMPVFIGRHYPADLPAYWESRQRRTIDFSGLNAIHAPLAYAGYAAALVVGAWAFRRRDRMAAGLALVAVLAILGNAFICGALSNPNDRYQARIAWVALFAAGVGAARLARREDRTALIRAGAADGAPG